jgi:hypothetical protein
MYAIAFVIALLIGTWVVERRRLPAGIALSTMFREVYEYGYDKAMESAKKFESERRKRKPDIHILEAHKWLFERHAQEVRMRLPNDLRMHRRLDREIQEAVMTLQDHIQMTRKRSPGESINFPYPLGEYFDEPTGIPLPGPV